MTTPRSVQIVFQRARLTPANVTTLRKALGYTGKTLAKYMGVAPETISRWEHGRLTMAVPMDRFLRLMVAHDRDLIGEPKWLDSVALGRARTVTP